MTALYEYCPLCVAPPSVACGRWSPLRSAAQCRAGDGASAARRPTLGWRRTGRRSRHPPPSPPWRPGWNHARAGGHALIKCSLAARRRLHAGLGERRAGPALAGMGRTSRAADPIGCTANRPWMPRSPGWPSRGRRAYLGGCERCLWRRQGRRLTVDRSPRCRRNRGAARRQPAVVQASGERPCCACA